MGKLMTGISNLFEKNMSGGSREFLIASRNVAQLNESLLSVYIITGDNKYAEIFDKNFENIKNYVTKNGVKEYEPFLSPYSETWFKLKNALKE